MMSVNPIAGATGAAGTAVTGELALGRSIGANSLAGSAGADFGEILGKLAEGTVSSLKTAEAASILGVRGQLTTQDVVEAVMNAEKSLQTAVAVRDKVVAAYLDLSRMAI
jgi:flagellar hook-basal body complex protein FliE